LNGINIWSQEDRRKEKERGEGVGRLAAKAERV